MNHEEKNIPFDIIAKVIQGEASVQEQEQITLWRSENEANELEFKNLEKILGSTPSDLPNFDTNQAWNKVNTQLENEQTKKPKIWLNIAIAACLIGAIFTFALNKDHNPNAVVVASTDGFRVVLPDSSIVLLKKNSSIEFSKTFDGAKRTTILKGEGFFKVRRDTSKPFVVNANDAQITVLGTSFNVKEDASEVQVVVNTGKVRVASKTNPKEKVVLTKGQSTALNISKHVITNESAINPAAHFWATKTLIFDRTKLVEVVDVINKVYGSNIQIENPVIEACKLTVTFKDKSTSDIVEVISATLGLEVGLGADGNPILKGEGCN